jgi:hypothetical protein
MLLKNKKEVTWRKLCPNANFHYPPQFPQKPVGYGNLGVSSNRLETEYPGILSYRTFLFPPF